MSRSRGKTTTRRFDVKTNGIGLAGASDDGRERDVLSDREIQCLQLIAGGKTSWAIAEILGISQHTVNAHIRNIVRKLGVASRPQAVAEAMRRGLIQ
jgi:DNA-binding CsgD family transcriptional regulator